MELINRESDIGRYFQADLQIIKDALQINSLSYDQLREITFWGADVDNLKIIENSEILALNSHENILRILLPLDSISEAFDWLRQFVSTINMPFPQLLHREKSPQGIDLFITAPLENLCIIAKEMRQHAFEYDGLCSITATCRVSTGDEITEKVISILEKNKIKILHMTISAMSVTVFILPNFRIRTAELLHQMVRLTN
jgi:aspartokinase